MNFYDPAHRMNCLPARLLILLRLLLCLSVFFSTDSMAMMMAHMESQAGVVTSTLRESVQVLSGFDERTTGSEGNRAAVAYIRERLSAANPDRLDSVRFDVPVVKHGGSKLRAGGIELDLQPLRYNVITPENLPAEGLRGKLLYAGKGELADFNGKKVAGAIVVMEFDSGRNWINAAALGASALIYINRTTAPQTRFAEKEELAPIQFPCFWIREADLAKLAAGADGDPALLNGMDTHVFSSMHWQNVRAESLYALFSGTDPDVQDQLLIVEAFYDTDAYIPGQAPGADEALSIAGLLNLADQLARHPPRRPFMLVANGAHAQELAGMREIIWAINARSKDLRAMDKQLKADQKTRSGYLDILQKFQEGGFTDGETLFLQKAVKQALKVEVDTISTELMRLRMRNDASSDSTGRIKTLAEKRFKLRRLGWRTSLADLPPETEKLLEPLLEKAGREHKAVLAEVKEQRRILKGIKRFRTLVAEFEPRAIVSLHLSSHGNGLGAFHDGFLYPLRPTINRTSGFRDIEKALQDSAANLPPTAPPFVSTLRPNRLRPWQDLLPDRPALGGEVSSLAGLPGLTLATVGDIRAHWSTPFDTPDRIDWEYASGQWLLALRLINGLDQAGKLETGYIRNGFSTVEGTASLLLHGDLFAEQPAPQTVLLAFQGPASYHLMTDRQGRFLLKGVADKKHVQDKVILEGYRFAEKDGGVLWAIDKKQTGKSSYRVKMRRSSMKTDLIMFQCRQTTIFNLLEPRSFRYMTKLKLIDGRREAPPTRYWYSRIDTRSSVIASIYLEPETPLKLTLSDSVLRKKMILTNGSTDNPQGNGYNISRNPSLFNTSFKTARDMWALLTPRIKNLQDHGIRDPKIAALEKEGKRSLTQAENALRDFRYDVFSEQSSQSWALASRVYDQVEKTQKDVLFGVLFYIALFVPFAFCLERLLFGFVSIYKRIGGFIAILLLLIAVIAGVHPAFELAYSPTVVILAFFIIGLSCIVTLIIIMRFEDEMVLLQRRTSHKRAAEISSWKAFTAAFFLGVSNLRRRRLRTGLTCLTLIILTFTIMSFTTVKSVRRQNRLQFADTAPYQGLLMKNIGWNELPRESLNVFDTLFHGQAVVAPRVWMEADERTRPMCIESCIVSEQPFILQGLTGLSPDEPKVSGLDRILVAGRWFKADEDRAVIIPSRLAARNGYDPNDPARSFITLWGLRLKIVGVFSEKLLEQHHDLDGEILTPVTFPSETVMEMSEVEKEALESGEDVRSFQGNYRHLSPDQVLIVPAAFLLESGGRLKAVALTPASGRAVSRDEIEKLTDRFALSLFSGESGGVFLYTASDTMSYAGMPNIIIPLLISILIVLNTMISSVVERKREIGVYTSIGLAPSHVGFLFIAEALAFAVLSVVLGYILAQTSAGLLAETSLWRGITVNYSSLAGVAAMILVMGVVLLSVIYPSRLASSIAIPDVNSSWSMPETEKETMDITLPFLMRYHENASIAGFLYSFFKGHQDVSHGIFSTGPVEIIKMDRLPENMLTMAPQCIHLRAKVWLAPFDFGIMQWVDIRFCQAKEGLDFLEICVTVDRMAGEVTLWQRVNRSFINSLRKQLLVWRSLDEEGHGFYADLLPEPSSTPMEKTA